MSKFVAIIPARYASTRFPGKPLALLGGVPIIQRVYERVAGVVSDVCVATDDARIEQRRLTQEQQDDLEAHHKLGAVAFVLVSFSLCDFYRIPWPVWRDMAETYGRKYVKQVELAPYEVPATAGYIKFLHGIVGQAGPETTQEVTP